MPAQFPVGLSELDLNAILVQVCCAATVVLTQVGTAFKVSNESGGEEIYFFRALPTVRYSFSILTRLLFLWEAVGEEVPLQHQLTAGCYCLRCCASRLSCAIFQGDCYILRLFVGVADRCFQMHPKMRDCFEEKQILFSGILFLLCIQLPLLNKN